MKNRNIVDCSELKDNNPTRLLKEQRERLKKIADLDILKEEMTEIIENSNISKKNLAEFYEDRDKISDLAEMQNYLWQYMLAGMGMRTFK